MDIKNTRTTGYAGTHAHLGSIPGVAQSYVPAARPNPPVMVRPFSSGLRDLSPQLDGFELMEFGLCLSLLQKWNGVHDFAIPHGLIGISTTKDPPLNQRRQSSSRLHLSASGPPASETSRPWKAVVACLRTAANSRSYHHQIQVPQSLGFLIL